MIRFIHCADIHLGKIQNNLEQRFEDFGAAFRQVIDEAIERQVHFLLIAGDLFDKRNINARTLEQAVCILEPLKKARVPVIAIEGNHDKAFLRDKESWMSFLANRGYITLLSPAFEGGKLMIEPYDSAVCRGCYIDLAENVRVYGLGYLGRVAADKLQELAENLPEEKTNILLLHAMVGRMGGEMIGSIPKGDVACLKEKVTYLALGHGHNRYVVETVCKPLERSGQMEVEGLNQEDSSIMQSVSIYSRERRDDQQQRGVLSIRAEQSVVAEIGSADTIEVNSADTKQISLFEMMLEELALQAEEATPLVEAAEGLDEEVSDEAVRDETEEMQIRIEAENVFAGADDYSQSWGHNPGSVEHCRIDEAEHNHGFYYVELEGKALRKVEHIQSNRRSARIIVTDITGSTSPESAYACIFDTVKRETTDLVNPLIRLIIKGEIGFDILEMDEEWIRAQVEEICAPLILEVDLRANLPQFSLSTEAELLDRQSIEREVLRKKVEDRAQWRHLGIDLVNLILELKEDVICGLPPEEVATKVLQMAGDNHENS